VFDAMLELPDNDFWDLLNGSKQPENDAHLTAVIHKIKAVRFNDQEGA